MHNYLGRDIDQLVNDVRSTPEYERYQRLHEEIAEKAGLLDAADRIRSDHMRLLEETDESMLLQRETEFSQHYEEAVRAVGSGDSALLRNFLEAEADYCCLIRNLVDGFLDRINFQL